MLSTCYNKLINFTKSNQPTFHSLLRYIYHKPELLELIAPTQLSTYSILQLSTTKHRNQPLFYGNNQHAMGPGVPHLLPGSYGLQVRETCSDALANSDVLRQDDSDVGTAGCFTRKKTLTSSSSKVYNDGLMTVKGIINHHY